ncbi:MAG: DUF4280 domain-containing protein [Acidimicrobiales bacterium]
MAELVCMGAMCECTFGVAPSTLLVLPENRVLTGTPTATIMDHIPMENIMPFGMCNSPTNPEVIAATAAALGVHTPMPCVPATTAPWVPGAPTVLIGSMPALTSDSKCLCMWEGVISVVDPGQFTTTAAG